MIDWFLAALGLSCCGGHSLAEASGGYSLVMVLCLLIAVASFVVEHGLLDARALVVVAHGPSCHVVCGIFSDQGSNPRPLHWLADS